MIAILHFIPGNPADILRAYREWMPPGGFLAVSHIDRTPQVEDAARVYDQAISPATPRTRDQVEAFFGDFNLIEPGLVLVPAWRPDNRVVRQLNVPLWGGVARKRPEAEATDD